MRGMVLTMVMFAAASAAQGDVRVEVDIEPPIESRYTGNVVATEKAIADRLIADVLKKQMTLSQWNYTSAPSAGTGVLRFRVFLDGADHKFELVLQRDGQVIENWPEVWLGPGGLGMRNGYPRLESAPTEYATEIGKVIIKPYHEQIFSRMRKHIPIASEPQWMRIVGHREEPRIVLPLKWSDSQSLSKSTFRVICRWPGKTGDAELRSEAQVEPAIYQDARSQQRYQALTVKPLERIYNRQRAPVSGGVAREVRQLQPFVVYLDEFEPTGLDRPVEPGR